MVHIFTPDELNAGISDKKQQKKDLADLRDALGRLYDAKLIRGALFHGSLVNGDNTIASDIDVVVLHSDWIEYYVRHKGRGPSEYQVRKWLEGELNSTRFDIVWLPGTPTGVELGNCYSDSGVEMHFAEYLELCAKNGNNIIGEDPTSVFEKPIKSKTGISLYQMKERLDYCERLLESSEDFSLSCFEKLIGMVAHTPLDFLFCLQGTIPSNGENPLTREGQGRAYENGLSGILDSKCFTCFWDAFDIRRKYEKMLNDISVRACADPEKYMRDLGNLYHAFIEVSRSFVRYNWDGLRTLVTQRYGQKAVDEFGPSDVILTEG